MLTLLALAAGLLAAANLVFVLVLVVRRVALARAERTRAALETGLRPLALDVADGDAPAGAALTPAETRVLAGILARYARRLDGASRGRITAWFEEHGAVATELRALRARRAWRRATAAAALGEMGSRTALDPLLAALHDRDREVRAAAARALGRLGAAEAAEPLARALVAGTVPRTAAGQALLTLGACALPALRALVAAGDAPLRAVAVELLGHLGDAGDGPALAARLRDPAAAVRAAACAALGRLGAEEEVASLHDRLDDRLPAVRAAAATALGVVGDRTSFDRLAVVAQRDDHVPAAAAAAALARIAPAALAEAARAPSAGPHLRAAHATAGLRAAA